MSPLGWIAFLLLYFFPVLGLSVSFLILLLRGDWKAAHPSNRPKKIALLILSAVTAFLALTPTFYFFVMHPLAAKLDALSPWTNVFYAYVWLGPISALLLFVFSILALRGKQKRLRRIAIISLAVACISTCWLIYQRNSPIAYWSEDLYHDLELANKLYDNSYIQKHFPLLLDFYKAIGYDSISYVGFMFMQSDNPHCIDIFKAAGGSPKINALYYSYPLYNTSLYGHKNVAERLLAEGAKVNTAYRPFPSPLFSALYSGQVEVAKLLLHHGADLEVRDSNGYTPLNCALRVQKPAGFLIELGADIHTRTYDGTSVLHYAAQQEYSEVLLDLIVKYKMNPNDNLNEQLSTPLHAAAGASSMTGVATLLAFEANIEARDKEGGTPLISAVRDGYDPTGVVEHLLSSGANVNARDYAGRTPLHCAAWRASPELAQLLVSHGANINAFDKTGSTPHDDACSIMHIWGSQVAAFLRSKGAKHNLFSAIASGDVQHVTNILESDKSIDVNKYVMGEIPLHTAARRGHIGVAKVLLAHGASINLRDASGATALHIAVENIQAEMVDFLLEHGADINMLDGEGIELLRTNLSLMEISLAESRITELKKFLLNHQAPLSMHSAVLANNTAAISQLLEENPKSVNDETTPLHTAVENRYYEAAQLLVAHGAAVNATNAWGMTPLNSLMYDTEMDQRTMQFTQLFLDHGADVDILDKEGYGPIENLQNNLGIYDIKRRIQCRRIIRLLMKHSKRRD
jgi:ankyrin repeat protein